MKEFTKRQMRIIIAMNLAVVALLCGLLFKYPFADTPANKDIDDYVHDIYRNARISLNVDLDFETNIGGSEAEELVASFANPASLSIHIFGNTQSSDYDFENNNAGIFFISTDRKGKIESVRSYGDNGDVLRKVIMAEGGYLLAVDNTVSMTTHLLHISYDGMQLKKIQHGVVSEERIADLILMESCYMLVVHSGITKLDFFDIKVFLYDFDMSEKGTAVLHNASYSQEYIAVLPKNLTKYIMAVNYKSELWNGMALVEFTVGSSESKKIQLENNYEAKNFMPCSGGYVAMIIDSVGRSSLITISSSDYSLREKKYLATSADDANLFFSDSKYYAYSKNSEATNMLKFNIQLSEEGNIALFRNAGIVYNSYNHGSGVLFACGGQDAAVIGLSSTQNWYKQFGSSGLEANTMLVILNNDIFVICESNRSGDDVGGNFGKNDIWLTKISI